MQERSNQETVGRHTKPDLVKDVFFLENPSGLVEAIAGLENLREFKTKEEPAPVTARLQCHVCSHTLEYDSRAHFVQCGNCNTLNAVRSNEPRGGRVMIVICGHCNTRNIAAMGSVYVECWLCHTVCQVEYPNQPSLGSGRLIQHSQNRSSSGTRPARRPVPRVPPPPPGPRRSTAFSSSPVTPPSQPSRQEESSVTPTPTPPSLPPRTQGTILRILRRNRMTSRLAMGSEPEQSATTQQIRQRAARDPPADTTAGPPPRSRRESTGMVSKVFGTFRFKRPRGRPTAETPAAR